MCLCIARWCTPPTLTLLSSPPDTNSAGPRCRGLMLLTMEVCSVNRLTCTPASASQQRTDLSADDVTSCSPLGNHCTCSRQAGRRASGQAGRQRMGLCWLVLLR